MAQTFLMRKSDYVVCGKSDYIVKENTHIPVTQQQMKWVQSNPKVNGPKMLLFFATTTGMADDIKDSAFMDILRKEQKAQDAGAPAYVPPVVEKPNAPVIVGDQTPVAPPLTGATETLRASLDQLPDADAVKAYAEKLLGKPLEVHPKAGKYKCIMATIAAMNALPSVTT